MIEATIESIRVSMVTQNRVVILREVDGERNLPIWIGAYEAEAIALAMQDVAPTRPLPYDLLTTILSELNAEVDRVMITELNHKVYYASIVVVTDGRTIEIDSRPSDALAIAIRSDARILVADDVMERGNISMFNDADFAQQESDIMYTGDRSESSSSESIPNPDLDVFRNFINSLDLDDFDKGTKG